MKIAIMGVDGSGKSSTIKMFESLEYTILYMGYNPEIREYSFFPSLKKIISKFGLGLFIYRIINDRFKIRKNINNLNVVYDRYPYDLLLYGKRGSLYNIKKFIINKFIDKPDLVFFLHGEPFLINQRKNELTEAQIKTMQDAYEYILDEFNLNNIKIDTVNKNINEVEVLIKEKLGFE